MSENPEESKAARPGYTYDPVEPIPEHMQPAPPTKQPGNLRDVDTSETLFKFKTLTWSFFGGVFCALVGVLIGIVTGVSSGVMIVYVLVGLIGGWVATYHGTSFVANSAARGGASIYMPTGKSTPMDRQYSLAQSLVARGRFEDAAKEYERCTVAYPTDPEPFMRLARLHRDDLQRYEEAVVWFKRASAVPGVPPGTDIMAMRELIEVYTHRLRQPVAASPHLARLAAKHPGTPAAEWARRELADLKTVIREEQP